MKRQDGIYRFFILGKNLLRQIPKKTLNKIKKFFKIDKTLRKIKKKKSYKVAKYGLIILGLILLVLLVTGRIKIGDDQASLGDNFSSAWVTRHVDGDTIYVRLTDGREYKLRMIGIDAPETVHPNEGVEYYGQEASSYTKWKLLGRRVYLEKDVSDTDKYGRLLRYVWLDLPRDNSQEEVIEKMFNADLLAKGYAQASSFPPDTKYQDIFTRLARKARKEEIGLWKMEEEKSFIDRIKALIKGL